MDNLNLQLSVAPSGIFLHLHLLSELQLQTGISYKISAREVDHVISAPLPLLGGC